MVRPKTSVERYADFKERLKLDTDKYNEFKRRKSEQVKACRLKRKQLMTDDQKDLEREYERTRKQKQRAAKAQPLKVKICGGKLPYVGPITYCTNLFFMYFVNYAPIVIR